MSNVTTISVVVCTCNGERFLAEQLSTLLTQSRLPDQIVISDDASSDGSWSMVESFAAKAKASGIAVHTVRRPERLGYIENFSRSLAIATGDLVFLCDQDDAWHPDKLAVMEACFRSDASLTLLHSNARLVSADGVGMGHTLFEALGLTASERERVQSGRAFEVYLRRNMATGATTGFRRALLGGALPIPPSWIHDAWLAIWAAATGKVAWVEDPLIDYRQHGANQIGMRRRTLKMRIEEFRTARGRELAAELVRLDALADRLATLGASPRALTELSQRRTHVATRLRVGEKRMPGRLPMVAREWMDGGYTRFATGTVSALRDLLRKG